MQPRYIYIYIKKIHTKRNKNDTIPEDFRLSSHPESTFFSRVGSRLAGWVGHRVTRPDSTRPVRRENLLTRPDPTRPDPTRPDPTRPDPTRPDPTRPDPTRLNPRAFEPGTRAGSCMTREKCCGIFDKKCRLHG